MALNEIQMKTITEGLTGTEDRVHELSLPVDRSEAEVEGQGRVTTLLEPIREEDEDGGAGRTHQPVGDPKNKDHTVTEDVDECRTCGPDEEIPEPDNLLVKLGCHCRGSLRMMHRKCILAWYGPRICQEYNYECELCNGLVHGRIEQTVYRALLSQGSGLDILLKAMRIAPRNSIVETLEAPTLEQVEAYEARNARRGIHEIDILEINHDPVRNIVEITQGPIFHNTIVEITEGPARNIMEDPTVRNIVEITEGPARNIMEDPTVRNIVEITHRPVQRPYRHPTRNQLALDQTEAEEIRDEFTSGCLIVVSFFSLSVLISLALSSVGISA